MKFMMMKVLMVISTTIPLLKNPMAMGILLIMQTSIATMVMANIMTTSWMSMLMFLMMVGGLLILFMYMSSIASNEKFSLNFKIMIPLTMLITPMEELISEFQINEEMSSMSLMSESLTLTKILNKKTWIITILLFLYMFLTMIVITKIVNIFSGPLRSKYY